MIMSLYNRYNAAILTELAVSDYQMLIVQDSFLYGAPYSSSVYNHFQSNGDEIAYLQAHLDEMQMLDNADCIKAYWNPPLTARADLLLVSDFVSNSSVAVYSVGCPMCSDPIGWLCEGIIGNWSSSNGPCTTSELLANIGNASNWEFANYRVKYCLSQVEAERCKIKFSVYIMIAVIVCNVVKLVCMVLHAVGQAGTLLTVGDAIDSFLAAKDTTTENMCLISKPCIGAAWSEGNSPASQKWTPKSHFWFAAVSIKQWLFFYVL